MSAPSRRTLPAVHGQAPPSNLTRVDLPEADGPITPSDSPRASSKLTLARMVLRDCGFRDPILIALSIPLGSGSAMPSSRRGALFRMSSSRFQASRAARKLLYVATPD